MLFGFSNSKRQSKLGKKVRFEYYAPHAKQVQLVGTLNQWDSKATALKKDRQGKWRVDLNLSAGRYEYRYLVDGSWENDQRPVECVPNVFGSWNCVLKVS